MAARAALLLALAAISLASLPGLLASEDNCVYTIFVRTGSIWKGGTDSTISVVFYDSKLNSISISNLTQWGGSLQGPDYNYFERGNLDIFSGLGYCLDGAICGLNLTSDGSGSNHGWYVNYVEVTATGPHLGCGQHTFNVDRWLATDVYPYTLASQVDECDAQNDRSIHQPVLRGPV